MRRVNGIMATVLVGIVLMVMAGCMSRASHDETLPPAATAADEGDEIRLIAVMPVDDRVGDAQASEMLREELLQQLYFKCYPKVPLSFVDERLETIAGNTDALSVSTQWAAASLGVDALLYTTLTEWSVSRTLLYGSTRVAASFELKKAGTGETLWRGSHAATERHVGITGKRVEGKAYMSCGEVLRKAVETVLSTFPEGPEALNPPLPDTRPWYRRWLRR
ncbi:MAG: DUF799 family lipoprotein [Syntrophales bacterium]|jgi:hypothetical protein|nr:DUF799 family lipoprotein [Syntrophales bacterium]MCK9527806.1 DUF799 family lipoprotein [Syntrophales bacterium]MDX9922097.1 DUF799 family lipoprotein [Syntrophales bacterium]